MLNSKCFLVQKLDEVIFTTFENLAANFGTLGVGIVKIGHQIRTRCSWIRIHANFSKFGCIISHKDNQLACFFGHPAYKWNKEYPRPAAPSRGF